LRPRARPRPLPGAAVLPAGGVGAGAGGIIAQAFPGKDSLQACVKSAAAYEADLFVVTEMSHPGAELFMAPLAEKMARMAAEVGAAGVVAPATRPERIKQIAEGIGAVPDKVLKNIFVARAFNSDHQILLLDKITEMVKNGEPIRLVVIDSLTAHFRAEFAGRGQLADRQQKLNKYLHNLMKIAESNNIAIYVTNQVMSNPGMMFGDPTTAIGGNIVGHASTYRIYLRRSKKDSRVAKLVDSPNLPDSETIFYVAAKGVCDESGAE
jgi:RecA/RadA recombinase